MTNNDDRNKGPASGRDPTTGRFVGGNAGRPRGARHKTTIIAEALLDGEAPELIRKAIQMAMDGDSAAMRLLVERILPPRRDSTVEVELPPIANGGAPVVIAALLEAVASGEVTPSEAQKIGSTVGQWIRAVELAELESRIAALEGERSRVGALDDRSLIATARQILDQMGGDTDGKSA
jgi:hypothetical protein